MLKSIPWLVREHNPPAQWGLAPSGPLAASPAEAPQARYLNSFLVTEQLESAAVVLREGADLEVKCWRPPLSLLGKRFGLRTELYWIIYHLPFSHVTQQQSMASSWPRGHYSAHSD